MPRPLLHVLTDGTAPAGRDPAEHLARLVRAGADVIQFRDKARSARDLERAARAARDAVRAAGGRLVINDHVDLAVRLDADGVHLGPDDRPPEEAREVFGGWIGVSARTVESARRAAAAGADYLGVGPVYGTVSKPDAPGAIGLEALARVAAAVDIPVLGIGGIDASNAAAVLRAGAAGVAVLGAVSAAPDPERAVRELRAALDAEGEVAPPDGRC